MTAQCAKGNLGAKAPENKVTTPLPRLLHPGTGKKNLDFQHDQSSPSLQGGCCTHRSL